MNFISGWRIGLETISRSFFTNLISQILWLNLNTKDISTKNIRYCLESEII